MNSQVAASEGDTWRKKCEGLCCAFCKYSVCYLISYPQVTLIRVNSCYKLFNSYQFVNLVAVVQSPSCVRPCVTPRAAARQASLSFTISWNLLKLMSTELMIPSNCLILCLPLLFLPSLFPSIRVFSPHQGLFPIVVFSAQCQLQIGTCHGHLPSAGATAAVDLQHALSEFGVESEAFCASGNLVEQIQRVRYFQELFA